VADFRNLALPEPEISRLSDAFKGGGGDVKTSIIGL
jgi:hypothetical protein